MPCYKPLTGFRSKFANANGRRPVFFKMSRSADEAINIPCGQCIGCRLERSRQWALRCFHEASVYDRNCFITLTYADSSLPADGSLVKAHFQKFMKRLRRRFPDEKIRYFMCGEYGEKLRRPHYHACLFNFDFEDKELFRDLGDGSALYVSAELAELWPFGFSTVGTFTFETAAYTARYVLKKVTGEKKFEHYVSPDGVMLQEEYTAMSRGGKGGHGIGHDWLMMFRDDVYPADEVIVRGHPCKPPRFYDKKFEEYSAFEMEVIRGRRVKKAFDKAHENSDQRLRVREKVKKAQLSFLKRSFESET